MICIFNKTKFLLSLLFVDDIYISLVPKAALVVITSLLMYGSYISLALFTLIVILVLRLFVLEFTIPISSFFWFTLLDPLLYLFPLVRWLDPLDAPHCPLTLPLSIRAPIWWLYPKWKLWLQADVVVMLPLFPEAFLGVFPMIF